MRQGHLQLYGTIFIVAIIALLMAVGLVALYGMSVSDASFFPFFFRQGLFVSIGIGVMLLMRRGDYNVFLTYATPIYGVILVLLILVLAFGDVVRGTVGWISIGSIHIQPVEIVKIFMIIFLAGFITTKRALLGEMMTIITSFILTSIVIGLILLQPDTGSALVVLAIWLGMIVLSGLQKRYILSFLFIGTILLMIAWTILAPYQRARITNFLHPENDPQNTGYNVIQSIIAVGNGGLTGQGIGVGTQSHLNFLPEKHTDFIFASLTESLGFVGATFILGLFFMLFVLLYTVGRLAHNAFGYFLIVGITILLFVHMLVNIGMNIGLMPVTGIPLPFISYGGSALLSMSFAIGLVLSVYRLQKSIREEHVRDSY